jgi:hypothetical protein
MSGFTVQMRGLHAGQIPQRSLEWLAATLQAIVDEA